MEREGRVAGWLVRAGLRFDDPAVERDFRAYHVESALPILRVNARTSLVAWLLGHPLFALLVPGQAVVLTVIACVAVYPAMIAHLVLLNRRRFRLGVPAGMVGNVTSGATLVYILGVRMGEHALAGSAIVILVFIAFVVVRLRVAQALLISVTNVLLYKGALFVELAAGDLAATQIALLSFFTITALVVGTIACYVAERASRTAFTQERTIAAQQAQIRAEQARAERLLLNVLPAPVAAILKQETRTIAEHHDEASVLFADVAGFTPISATMAPAELVGLLDEVFTCFDDLAEKHGVEKIKTIGDCYMVAAGVPVARPDHAAALARMALEVRDTLATREFRGRRLLFRIGINSGPVVAGVIGKKRFIYDLWGDAVNVASRMESHGTGGEIQISRRTRELLGDAFECVSRGTIAVKGKGEMEVWHVLRENLPVAVRQSRT